MLHVGARLRLACRRDSDSPDRAGYPSRSGGGQVTDIRVIPFPGHPLSWSHPLFLSQSPFSEPPPSFGVRNSCFARVCNPARPFLSRTLPDLTAHCLSDSDNGDSEYNMFGLGGSDKAVCSWRLGESTRNTHENISRQADSDKATRINKARACTHTGKGSAANGSCTDRRGCF